MVITQLTLLACSKRRKCTLSRGSWPLLLTKAVNEWTLSQRKRAWERKLCWGYRWALAEAGGWMATLLRFTDVLLLRPLLNTYKCLCAFCCGGDTGSLPPGCVEGMAQNMVSDRPNCCDQSFCPDIEGGNWLENSGQEPECCTTECSKFSASSPRANRGGLFRLFSLMMGQHIQAPRAESQRS